MRSLLTVSALGLALAWVAPASAQDSLRISSNDSGASMAAVSVGTASVLVVSAYVGGVMVVESVKVVGGLVEVALKGAGAASLAVVTVTAAAASTSAVAAGQTVKVVAEGTGYLLVTAGKVLCFVPGAKDQKILRSQRSS